MLSVQIYNKKNITSNLKIYNYKTIYKFKLKK